MMMPDPVTDTAQLLATILVIACLIVLILDAVRG